MGERIEEHLPRIRPSRPSDREALRQLVRNGRGAAPRRQQHRSAVEPTRWWVAHTGNHLVGLLGVIWHSEDIFEMTDLSIARAWAGRELCCCLIGTVLGRARRAGALKLIVGSGVCSDAVARRVRSSGFIPDTSRPSRWNHCEYYTDLYTRLDQTTECVRRSEAPDVGGRRTRKGERARRLLARARRRQVALAREGRILDSGRWASRARRLRTCLEDRPGAGAVASSEDQGEKSGRRCDLSGGGRR